MQEAQDQAGALAEQGACWPGPEAQGMSRPDGKARQLEAMRAEIEQLRAQLGEAEETLRAIREGEVDAIVVSGSQGDQVFSLTGAESVYRLIVETMKEAALTVTTDGRILFCNAQFSAFVQTPPERILGRPLAEFVAPDSRAPVASLLARSQEGSVKHRLVFQGSEGPPVLAHVSATALYQADSLSICLVATDLTELEASTELLRLLQREQEALRASETEFRAFFDTAAVGATELDLDGRFVRVNDRYCELTGFSREELLGMTPGDLAPPEDRAVDQARVAAQLRESSTVFEVEKRYVRKDGRVIWVRVSAAPIRDAAGVCYSTSTGSFRDVFPRAWAVSIAASSTPDRRVTTSISSPLTARKWAHGWTRPRTSLSKPRVRLRAFRAKPDTRHLTHLMQQQKRPDTGQCGRMVRPSMGTTPPDRQLSKSPCKAVRPSQDHVWPPTVCHLDIQPWLMVERGTSLCWGVTCVVRRREPSRECRGVQSNYS